MPSGPRASRMPAARQAAVRHRKEWVVRLSSLVIVAAVLLCAPGLQATSPPNLHEALRLQQAQADLHPNDPEILNDLGNLLVLAGSVDEAEEAYRRSLEIDPDNTTTRYNLALALMEQGRNKQATQELHSLLEVDPYHAWALYQLGTISATTGRRTKAVDYYTRALNLNPELASPAVNPHIIENRYLTESQLRLYLQNAEAAQAPRLYQRPGEVAKLLIPAADPAAQPGPDQAPAAEAESQPEVRTLTLEQGTVLREDPDTLGDDRPLHRETQPPVADEPDAGPRVEQSEAGDSPRTLSEEDLAPSSVGAGGGYVSSPAQAPSRRPTTRPGGAVSYPGTATSRSGSPSTTTPPQPQTTGSDPFVPAVGSTGRLDLELLFEDGSTTVAPGP